MPYRDPDSESPRVVAELAKMYERSAARLRQIVLNPHGSTDSGQAFNRGRAAQLLAQVDAEIRSLKNSATTWIGPALSDAFDKGINTANAQAITAGVVGPDLHSKVTGAGFNMVDRDAVTIIARTTQGDLFKAADSMRSQAFRALTSMADVGVSNADVNRIIAGGIIEGTPRQTIRTLRNELELVNGKKITIFTKSGGTITFDTGYYAKLVAVTKTREARVTARHERLADLGLDLVEIIGRPSKNPCSLLLGKIFSLSGRSNKYPAFSGVSEGQPPYHLFHPNCSKSTAPISERRIKREHRDQRSEAA